MSEDAEAHIAICYLLLKGAHWIPVAPGRKLTAGDRSSPEGPVIMAELIAQVDGGRIVGWRKVGAIFQDVGADGEVAPPDTRVAGAVMGALMADGTASANGAVGINSRIVERKRAREERRLPDHLHSSAVARAETQILDRLAGFNAVGVRLILASADEAGDPKKA